MGFGVLGLRFRVLGPGFRVRVWGLRVSYSRLWFRVWVWALALGLFAQKQLFFNENLFSKPIFQSYFPGPGPKLWSPKACFLLGFRVLGFRVPGLGFRVPGLGF